MRLLSPRYTSLAGSFVSRAGFPPHGAVMSYRLEERGPPGRCPHRHTRAETGPGVKVPDAQVTTRSSPLIQPGWIAGTVIGKRRLSTDYEALPVTGETLVMNPLSDPVFLSRVDAAAAG